MKAKDRRIKHGAHGKQGSNLISWTIAKRRPKYKIYVPLKEVAKKRENFPVMLNINKGHSSRMVMVNIKPCLHTTIPISPCTKVVFPRVTSKCVKKNPGRPQVYFPMIYKLFTCAYSDYEVKMNFYHIKGQHLKFSLFSISSHSPTISAP